MAFALVALVVVAVAWVNSSRDVAPVERLVLGLPEPVASRFLNATSDAEFCGAARCAACHPAESASYEKTGHRHAFAATVASEEPADGDLHDPRSGRRYTIERQGDQLWQRESLVGRDGSKRLLAEYPVAWTIGSGRFSRSYLVDVD
ncbi:MAG: hypothetical protein B7Z55_13030, partial [Planctomycetales bacterium 12-60-4]